MGMTIKSIPRCTGGKLFFYTNPQREVDNICNDLSKVMNCEYGWNGAMKVRLSNGVRIQHWIGNIHVGSKPKRRNKLVLIPMIDSDKTLAIDIIHDREQDINGNQSHLINSQYIYVQMALLYTTHCGKHRIRVCTKQIPLATAYKELFDGVNVLDMTALMAKMAVSARIHSNYSDQHLQGFIQKTCSLAMVSYCKYADPNNSLQTENDYPESLSLWPLYSLGLLKCRAFANIQNVARLDSMDLRSVLYLNILEVNANYIEQLIRPSLYRMDNIMNLDDDALNDEYWIPSLLTLSQTSIASDGIYLVNNGQALIIYIGRNVQEDVFDTFLQITDEYGTISLMDAEQNKYAFKFQSILQYLQTINYKNHSIRIISETESEILTQAFYQMFLIRDKTNSVMNLRQFLCEIAAKCQQMKNRQLMQERKERGNNNYNKGVYYD